MGLDSPSASTESPEPGASRRWADDEEADTRLAPPVPPRDSSGDRLTATVGSDPDHALCKEKRDSSMGESPEVKTTHFVTGETRTLHGGQDGIRCGPGSFCEYMAHERLKAYSAMIV